VAEKSLDIEVARPVRVQFVNHRAPAIQLQAHHNPAGGFRNPWPASQPHGIGDLLKWVLSRQRPRSPDIVGEPVRPVKAGLEAAGTGLAVTWIGHSTFLIQSGAVNVLTDPIWSNRASPVQFAGPRRHAPPGLDLDRLPDIEAVFISHDHYDHLDDGTVRRLIERFPHAKWITPLGVGKFIERRGAVQVTEMDWWEARNLGPLSASCTPAQHFSGRYPWNRNGTLWSGWVIGLGNHRLFFGGDTGFHPAFGDIARRFGPFDAVILPIGAYEPRWFMEPVHMNPEDAVAAYSEIAAVGGSEECVFIPSHWGTFRLTDEPLDEPPIRLSQAWSGVGLSNSRLWLIRQGETRWSD
jgi:N-acyl-phosphatidylethanolamine-hydrolysing phospholipase D